MKTLFLYAVTVSLATGAIALEQVRSEDGTVYYIELKPEYTWYGAVQECALRNKSLVSIETSSKQTQIANLLKKYHEQKGLVGFRTWIAGHDNAVHGDYTWITNGRRLSFTKWAPNEPNHSENEHCIEMRPGDYQWNDVRCYLKFTFICEENPLVIDKNRELTALRISYENDKKLLTKSQNLQLEQLKKSHENTMQEKVAALSELQNSCTKELQKLTKDSDHTLTNLKNSYETKIKSLKDDQIKVLEEAGKTYEIARAKDIEMLNQTCVTELQLLENRKNLELQQLKDDNKRDKLLDLKVLERTHEEDKSRLREEMKELKETCEVKAKQVAEEKYLELAALQKINEMRMNHTNTYKLYNIIFHGNTNKG